MSVCDLLELHYTYHLLLCQVTREKTTTVTTATIASPWQNVAVVMVVVVKPAARPGRTVLPPAALQGTTVTRSALRISLSRQGVTWQGDIPLLQYKMKPGTMF